MQKEKYCLYCGKPVYPGIRESWSCVNCGTWVEYWISTTLEGHIEGTSYESPLNSIPIPNEGYSVSELPKGTLLIMQDTPL